MPCPAFAIYRRSQFDHFHAGANAIKCFNNELPPCVASFFGRHPSCLVARLNKMQGDLKLLSTQAFEQTLGRLAFVAGRKIQTHTRNTGVSQQRERKVINRWIVCRSNANTDEGIANGVPRRRQMPPTQKPAPTQQAGQNRPTELPVLFAGSCHQKASAARDLLATMASRSSQSASSLIPAMRRMLRARE